MYLTHSHALVSKMSNLLHQVKYSPPIVEEYFMKLMCATSQLKQGPFNK